MKTSAKNRQAVVYKEQDIYTHTIDTLAIPRLDVEEWTILREREAINVTKGTVSSVRNLSLPD